MNRNALSQHQSLQQQQHQPQHIGSTGSMFERRQNKLPPRLAKQREQNRAIQKGQQHIHPHQQHVAGQESHNQESSTDITEGAESGWGGGDGLALVHDNSYGTAGWAKYEPSVQASMNNSSTDNLANMFEQMGKGQPLPCTAAGQPNIAGVGATNVAQKLLAAAAVGKDGAEQGVISHSGTGKHDESPGDHHVQTIIFENTNFKGGPPGTRVMASGEVGVGNTIGTNDKTVNHPAVAVAAQQLQFPSKCSEPGFKSDSMAAGGGVQSGSGIQIAGLGFTHKSSRKHGDNVGTPDLKIDFASFNSEMSMPVGSASVATSTSGGSSGINDQHVPPKSSHTAEELNMKIASVKKVWDTHSIEDQQQNGNGGPVFTTGSGFQNEGGSGTAADCRSKAGEQFSKTDVTTGISNKSRLAAEGVGGVMAYPPQHPALPQQSLSHIQTHQSGSSVDFDHRNSQRSMAAMAAAAAAASAVSGNNGNNTVSVRQGVQQSAVSGNNAASMAFSRLGLSALPSPPSILGNQAVAAAVAAAAQQPQSIYQTFQLDGRSAAAAAAVTNQLYPAYAAAAGMGGLAAATANDIFSAAAAGGNQFRLTPPQQFQQQSHQQPLVSSQPTSMMTSAMKQQHSQIGPIGTKGNQGGGHFQPQQQHHQPPPQSGLAHGNGGGVSSGGSGIGGGGGGSQGGLGGLPVTASSPLLIQYDAAAAAAAAGNYLPSALQRSAAAAALHSHHQSLQNPPPPQSGQTAFYQALSTQQHAAAAIQAATAAVAANQGRQQHQQQQNAAAAAAAVAAFASTGGSGGGSSAGLHGFHANGNFSKCLFRDFHLKFRMA